MFGNQNGFVKTSFLLDIFSTLRKAMKTTKNHFKRKLIYYFFYEKPGLLSIRVSPYTRSK